MTITYELTEKDFREAFGAYYKSRWAIRWARWVFLVGAVLVAILTVFLGVTQPPQDLLPIFGVLGFWVFLVYVFWVAPRLSARKQFRSQPGARGSKTLTTTDAGLAWEQSTAKAEAYWPNYVRWCESESVIVLLSSAVLMGIVPKRAFTPDQLAEFRQLLEQNIGPVNKQRKVNPS